MNKTALFALATGIAGLSACTHLRSPTDAQLVTLLHADRVRPNMPQIDAIATYCLRAWSNDAALINGLPANFAAEGTSKTSCRKRIDDWLADAERNPSKFSFDDISAPAVVRRVVALAAPASTATAVNQQADHAAPPPMMQAKLAPPANVNANGPHTDIGTTQALLKEADDSCKLAQQKAAAADASVALQRFAKYCAPYIQRAQATLADHSAANQPQVDAIARSAKGMTATAQRLLQQARRD